MSSAPVILNDGGEGYRLALLLHNEVNILITAMRQNSRWAFIQPYGQQGEELEGDRILQDLLLLRQKLFEWSDIRQVDPLTYLEPFLTVIQDVGVNGIITSVALLSLQRLLQKGVVGQEYLDEQGQGKGYPQEETPLPKTQDPRKKLGVARALRAVVQAVHGCKFEVADEASDGMVLCRILQTFMACVNCSCSTYLTNQDLYEIFCQVLKFADETMYADTKAHNEMVINFARQMAVEMVGGLFSKVGQMESMDQDAVEQFNLSQKQNKYKGAKFAGQMQAQNQEFSGVEQQQQQQQQSVKQGNQQQTQQVADSVQSVSMESAGQEADSQMSSIEVGEGEPNDKSIVVVQTTPNHRVMFSDELRRIEDEEQNMAPYGIETLTYMFAEIVDLLNSKDPIMSMLGLELAHEAIESAGKDLLQHASLMGLIKKRLFLNLVTLIRQHVLSPREPSVALLMRVNQVVFTVYTYLGQHMLLQIESFLHNVLLKAIDDRSKRMVVTDAMVEVALEGLVSLVSQPEFIHHCYANLDCRIEHSNLFEDICNTLAKRAFPVANYQLLTPVHQLALTGLVQILSNLGRFMEEEDAASLYSAFEDHTEYQDIWTPLMVGALLNFKKSNADSDTDISQWKFNTRRERYFKTQLASVAEIFGEKYKKSLELLETNKLISQEPQKRAFDFAAFLRVCPGLSKTDVGTVLGEKKDFLIEVLNIYGQSFNFKGMDVHLALRLFLESFRLPGEGQKIDRVVESFARSYRMQNASGPCKTEDAVHVVAYALIMLNSNLFNPNVRLKDRMTFKSFRRQLEGQNDGENFPEQWLMDLFNAISLHEIKLIGEGEDIDVSEAQWADMFMRGTLDRGKTVYKGCLGAFTWDMFEQSWGAMVHAITTVLEKSPQDQQWDISLIQHCLRGIQLAAQVGAHYNEEKVLDNLISSLAHFTQILNPSNASKSVVTFQRSFKAKESFKVMFKDIVHKYGDGLQQGWTHVVDCVIRLFKLDLLPGNVFTIESEQDGDGESIPSGLRRSASNNSNHTNQSSSFLRGLFLFGEESSAISQETEKEALEKCKKLVEECRIGDILLDSKFLRKESLMRLIEAIISAAGLVKLNAEDKSNQEKQSGNTKQQQHQSFDIEVQEVCLELLITITIRNRDRITVLWPLVSQHLETIMLLPYSDDTMLSFIERAVLGLLRICQRLLPYKEEVTDQLMRTLQKVVSLDSERALDLVPGIARGVLILVKTTAAHINTPSAWVTICSLLRMTFVHQEARPMVVQALQIIVNQNDEGGSLLRPLNFGQCSDTCRDMIRLSRGEDGEWAKISLDMIEQMCNWLVTQVERLVDAGKNGDGQSMGMVSMFWHKLVQVLVEAGLETLPQVREHAMVSLHRILIQSDQLGLQAPLILQSFKEQLLPMANELSDKVARPQRDFPAPDSTLRLLVHAISKTYLQYLDLLKSEPEFILLWQALLNTLATTVRNRSEILKETVPEQVKNILLVMYSRGVLVPEWKDEQGHSMWEASWKKAQQISPGLTVEIINISPQKES